MEMTSVSTRFQAISFDKYAKTLLATVSASLRCQAEETSKASSAGLDKNPHSINSDGAVEQSSIKNSPAVALRALTPCPAYKPFNFSCASVANRSPFAEPFL